MKIGYDARAHESETNVRFNDDVRTPGMGSHTLDEEPTEHETNVRSVET